MISQSIFLTEILNIFRQAKLGHQNYPWGTSLMDFVMSRQWQWSAWTIINSSSMMPQLISYSYTVDMMPDLVSETRTFIKFSFSTPHFIHFLRETMINWRFKCSENIQKHKSASLKKCVIDLKSLWWDLMMIYIFLSDSDGESWYFVV